MLTLRQPVLKILSAWLGSNKYQFCMSLVLLDQVSNPLISPKQDMGTLLIQPSRLVRCGRKASCGAI